MKPYYKYLEHTADILFQAEASSLEELFRQCALAVEESMVDVQKVKPLRKVQIKHKNKNIDYLLFDFLCDLNYYKDAKQLMFSKFDLEIKKVKDEYRLMCRAWGEKLDVNKHNPKVDIKAITLHMFEVKQTKKGWFAQVLVDI